MINISQLELPFNESFTTVPDGVIRERVLPSGAKIALIGLLSFRNRKTGKCNPRVRVLADRIGVSRSTAHRRLRTLRRAGILTVTRHRGASDYVISDVSRNSTSDTSESDTFDTSRCRTSDTSGGVVSLYEPENLNLKAPAPVTPSPKAAAAAAFSPPGIPTQTKKPPRSGASRNPAPEIKSTAETRHAREEAEEIAYELLREHPQPGMVDKAVDVIAERIGRRAASSASLRESHAQWCKWWAVCPGGTFVPMLWRWVASNDWRTPPGAAAVEKAARKPPQRETGPAVGTPEWSASLREGERQEILMYMQAGHSDEWFHKEGYPKPLTAECRKLVPYEEADCA